MRLTFDTAQRSIVVVCECGWRAITTNGKSAANQLAGSHQTAVHPGDRRMMDQLNRRRTRHLP